MFFTQNDTGLGYIWNPFTTEYTEEHKAWLLKKENDEKKAKVSLSILAALATSGF